MEYFDTVVIGAGQAGLAMSRCLRDTGVDHVVLERGRLAERWRSERWDSLRMLTPNWMTRLPGRDSQVDDPDGFMSKDDLVGVLESYASSFGAPVREQTEVTRVEKATSGFVVTTDSGAIAAANVVIATGQCGRPTVPSFADRLDPSITGLHASGYRNPDHLPAGGVLVVGSGASGMQIAAELAETGREVILATGRHARAVRRYRGRDLWWWMEQTGSLDQTVDEVGDIESARMAPSLALTGAAGGRDIDLGTLQGQGVRIAGRLLGVEGLAVEFGRGVTDDVAEADHKLRRLLDRFDEWANHASLDEELEPPVRLLPIRVHAPLVGGADLAAAGVRTVVWATGYRQSYPWLDLDVLNDRGEMIHRRGVTDVPGLYALGLRFLWRRGSHFVDGVGRDAEYLAAAIGARMGVAAVA